MKSLSVVVISLVALFVILFGIGSLAVHLTRNNQSSTPDTKNIAYEITEAYPHDQKAFTEGLVCDEGFLYESTGLYGSSTLRRVDLASGEVLLQISLPNQFFGEGITVVNDTIVQLTWQSHVGFVYDKESLNLLSNFSYPTEGWGITFDGQRLVMSDGSDKLFFLNASTFKVIDQIEVHDGNSTISELNELEYINGDIYANVWHQEKIAIINPETGLVKGWIDLTGLNAAISNNESVLNGIAYDAKEYRLFVTGKNWASVYEIKLVI